MDRPPVQRDHRPAFTGRFGVGGSGRKRQTVLVLRKSPGADRLTLGGALTRGKASKQLRVKTNRPGGPQIASDRGFDRFLYSLLQRLSFVFWDEFVRIYMYHRLSPFRRWCDCHSNSPLRRPYRQDQHNLPSTVPVLYM